MNALKTTLSSQTKLKKLVTTSCRPMKSVGRSKSIRPLKVKVSRPKTKVAKS